MPGQPHARDDHPSFTSLETSPSSATTHLRPCLNHLGLTDRADQVGRCCQTFRILTCPNGHSFRPIPAERCRHRLCRNCPRWRQQRAITRHWHAIRELSRRYPEDHWVFITLTAKASDEPLRTRVHRFKRWFARLRRTSAWETAIRGAIAGYEVTYRPGRGWRLHEARQPASLVGSGRPGGRLATCNRRPQGRRRHPGPRRRRPRQYVPHPDLPYQAHESGRLGSATGGRVHGAGTHQTRRVLRHGVSAQAPLAVTRWQALQAAIDDRRSVGAAHRCHRATNVIRCTTAWLFPESFRPKHHTQSSCSAPSAVAHG
jgi:Replication protein